MKFETLETERHGAILRVRLNRPERRNALNGQALEEIADLFSSLQRDFETRVAILAGNGASFCAGADRKDPPGGTRMTAASGATDREQRWVAQLGLRACRALEDAEVVTLARIHGHAIGGGFALALACDFRIAALDSVFQVPEVDLGIPLTWGATPRLAHEVGAARAREIILLCDRFDAQRAEAWGVVHRAVPLERLDAEVDAWAQRLAAKPEIAVHMTKSQLRGLAQRARLGDLTETDGDLLLGASRRGVARQSFPAKKSG